MTAAQMCLCVSKTQWRFRYTGHCWQYRNRVISVGSVANPAALVPGNNYSINFTSPTTYDVTYSNPTATPAVPPLTPMAPPLTAQPYVSGQAIAFGGMQFDIQGAPATGDSFRSSPVRT